MSKLHSSLIVMLDELYHDPNKKSASRQGSRALTIEQPLKCVNFRHRTLL